jgi:hypothetical protein
MTTQSSQERRIRVPQWKNQLQERISLGILHRVSYPLDTPAPTTEAEKNQVLTGFILGALSIFTGFFPICGLPIAIAGLLMSLAGQRIAALRRIASWGVALSVIGLILALANIIISVTIYFSVYLWQ